VTFGEAKFRGMSGNASAEPGAFRNAFFGRLRLEGNKEITRGRRDFSCLTRKLRQFLGILKNGSAL
jgi:hypothetical protein